MKRLSIIIAYVLLSFAAVVTSFSLLALASSSAYARDDDADYGRSLNDSRPAKAGGDVRVDNLAGNVTVEGWDKNEVHVSGTLSPSAERLEFTSDDSGVTIRVILPHEGRNYQDDEGSDLVIDLPRGSRLDVSTVSADVVVKDVSGPQELGTVSGNITLTSSSTRVETKSVSGDVTVNGSGSKAHVNASSISGTVYVTDMDGTLEASSVSGDVKVGHNKLSGATLSSTSGNLRCEGTLQKDGDYEFHNVSGDVELYFGATPDARFDVSSFSGDIRNTFGPKPTRVSKYSPGEELHFTSGNGGAQVTARTLSGDVRLSN
jgi:DUF4097 and DUF4098 domain-containing protein YvlB